MTVEDVLANPETVEVPTDKKKLFKLIEELGPQTNYKTVSQVLAFLERIPIEYAGHCLARARETERAARLEVKPEDMDKFNVQKLMYQPEFKTFLVKHHNEIVDNGFFEPKKYEQWKRDHEDWSD